MSDFTDSLRSLNPEDDSEFKNFVLELFDRVNQAHSEAKTELEEFYHQGEKDALRRVLAVMTNSDIDMIIPSSVVAHKLRGDIRLDNGKFIKEK